MYSLMEVYLLTKGWVENDVKLINALGCMVFILLRMKSKKG